MKAKVYTQRRLFYLNMDFQHEWIDMRCNRLYNMLDVSFEKGKLSLFPQFHDLMKLVIAKMEGDPIDTFKQGDWVEVFVTRPKDSSEITVRLTRKLPPNGGFIDKLLWAYGFTSKMRYVNRPELFETYLPDYVNNSEFERGFSIIPGATSGKRQYSYFQGYKVEEGLILVFGSRTIEAEYQHPVAYWIDKAATISLWKLEGFMERHNSGTIPLILGMGDKL